MGKKSPASKRSVGGGVCHGKKMPKPRRYTDVYQGVLAKSSINIRQHNAFL